MGVDNFGKVKGVEKVRCDYIKAEPMRHVLAALTDENRLVMEVCLATGLRVSDALQLRPKQVEKGRFTVYEKKTGKTRRVYLPVELRERLLRAGNEFYCFPHRYNGRKPRTRAAVWKDVKRAAAAFRLRENVGTHTARKNWAVAQMEKSGGDLAALQKQMNHSSPEVTLLYAMADKIAAKGGKKNKCSR